MFPNDSEIHNEIKEIYKELEPWYSEFKRPEQKKISDFFRSPFLRTRNTKLKDKDLYVMSEPLRTKSILKDLNDKGLINLYQNSVAISLEDGENDKNSVHFLNYYHDGKLKKIYGDLFIISCGALETPRLILQSSSKNKFTYMSNLAGTNLIDHPWTIVGVIKSKRPLVTNHFYSNSSKLSYRRGHTIQIESNGNIKNHGILYRPYQFGNMESIKLILTRLLISRSIKTWIRLLKEFRLIDIISTVIYMISEKYNLSFLNYKCAIYLYMDQDFNPNSNITLSKKTDEFGRNIPKINWDHGIAEQSEIAEVNKILEEEFENSENFSYSSTTELWDKLSSGSHHAGTMRIGNDEVSGVIDKNLRLFEKQNVFVCDLSIFPRFGNSNPTYTLSAFSRRLGKYIYKNFI